MKRIIYKPLKSGFLHTKHHSVRYETYGNSNGEPWIFFHGGPGYHCVPESNLKNFDLKKQFVILFDQRGSGQSQPHCELKHNTTGHLVNDVLALLNKFNIEKVNILGGSWGATLALVFAIENPNRVKTLLLRGSFLGRHKDIMAIYKPKKDWPENQKEKYDLTLGKLVRKFKIKNLFKDALRIIKRDDKKSDEFVKLWAAYEDLICSTKWKLLEFDNDYLRTAKAISIIEIHYFLNNCFLPNNFILKNVKKLKDTSVHFVHGKEDMVCPISQVLELKHKMMRNKQRPTLFIDKNGGHSSSKKMNDQIQKIINGVK